MENKILWYYITTSETWWWDLWHHADIDQVLRTSSCLTFKGLVILFLIKRRLFAQKSVLEITCVPCELSICLYLIPELRKKEGGKSRWATDRKKYCFYRRLSPMPAVSRFVALFVDNVSAKYQVSAREILLRWWAKLKRNKIWRCQIVKWI